MSSNYVLCPLGRDGTLECWVAEPKDGNWIRSAQLRPRKNVSAVSASHDDVCAIQNGIVSCVPIAPVGEHGWHEIPGVTRAVGVDQDPYTHLTCALLESGEVLCWNGINEPDSYRLFTPPFALNVADAVEIAVDKFGVCVRTRAGAVRCGQPTERDLVEKIAAGAVEIAGGRDHWCARIDADDNGISETVECHGSNNVGQLGRLGNHVMLTPTKIELPRPE
jgi:hypothetical protein